MKKILNLSGIKTIGTQFSDEQICQHLGIEVPQFIPSNRQQATKILANFQTKKSYAIQSANKLLKHMKVQLAQKSHTTYEVVSVETKKARLTAQASRMKAALERF